MRLILPMLIALLVAACSTQSVLDRVSSAEDRQLSQRLIADVQKDDGADFAALLAPELRPIIAAQWPAIHAALPQGPARLVDAGFNYVTSTGGPGVRYASLAYEVDQGVRHALVRIAVQRADKAIVTAFYVKPIPNTVESLTEFGLTGKSPAHYAVLLLAIAAFCVIVLALVLIVRTRGVRRKWLWFLGSLFGFGQVAIDWSTGAIAFNPLYFQLLGAFAIKPSGISDWQIGFGLPVVAILFLILRPRLRARAEDPAQVFS